MKRRERPGVVPAELLDFTVWCKRRGVVDPQWDTFSQWCDARGEWDDAHGWPGGVVARWDEERRIGRAVPYPPFDPSTI